MKKVTWYSKALTLVATIIMSGCTTTYVEFIGDVYMDVYIELGEEECLKRWDGSSVDTL